MSQKLAIPASMYTIQQWSLDALDTKLSTHTQSLLGQTLSTDEILGFISMYNRLILSLGLTYFLFFQESEIVNYKVIRK